MRSGCDGGDKAPLRCALCQNGQSDMVDCHYGSFSGSGWIAFCTLWLFSRGNVQTWGAGEGFLQLPLDKSVLF